MHGERSERPARWAAERFLDTIGLDGAQWVMEGIVDGRYHLVDRWSPVDGDAFKAACMYLKSLTPLTGQ